MVEPIRVEAIGRQGDAYVTMDGDRVFLPLAVDGDQVLITGRDKKVAEFDLVEPSPHRAEPFCAHYGQCGGCQLQHLTVDHYDKFKRQVIQSELQRQGLEVDLKPTIKVPLHSRRRAVFSVIKRGERCWLGYKGRRASKIEEIKECPLLDPSVSSALPQLRALARNVKGKSIDFALHVTATDVGLDVALVNCPQLDRKTEGKLTEAAMESNFARLSYGDEILLEIRKPVEQFASFTVPLPPMPFLQASRFSQAAMIDLALKASAGSKRLFDLFCGVGTFALPLSNLAQVFAVDNDETALKALQSAINQGQPRNPVKAVQRNLFRHPVTADEFGKADTILFDPPRAGANEQVQEIATSKAQKVIAVSCNPATWARDLATLTVQGFRLNEVTPIDQFLYSAHVEVIAILER